jgi:hypothetical protein
MHSDPNYVIQGMYSDGTIAEEDGAESHDGAIECALGMLSSLTFEGSQVCVTTRDGEIVFEGCACACGAVIEPEASVCTDCAGHAEHTTESF